MNSPALVALAHLFGQILAALVAVLVLLRCVRAWGRRRARRRVLRVAEEMVSRHLPALVRRRLQLVRPDSYGKPQLGKWQKEIDYFIDTHIAPALPRPDPAVLQATWARLAAEIADRVEREALAAPGFRAAPGALSPEAFEAFCAEELRRSGWDARLSAPGPDQGVDVLAEKGGTRLVVQCKLLGRPVGNKAVQEAVAARGHERADFAAVVSNQPYTAAAQELAASNGVLLLHPTDLWLLAARLTGH